MSFTFPAEAPGETGSYRPEACGAGGAETSSFPVHEAPVAAITAAATPDAARRLATSVSAILRARPRGRANVKRSEYRSRNRWLRSRGRPVSRIFGESTG